LQEDWSPRWCRQPLNAAALNTVMGSKKNQDESNPSLWTCSCGACLYQPFLCW
jgi:hypothetical protein